MSRDFNFILKGILIIGTCVFFFFLPKSLFSQTVFKGVVLDADTDLPLPYVNIGFIDRELGTVSEENGTFNFSFDSSKLSSLDTLKISSLAYKEFKLPFVEMQHLWDNPVEFKIEPEIINLNEVVLTSGKRKSRSSNEKMVGYSYVGQLKNGSWEGEGALGGELVTKINVNKKKRKLNAFYFYVLENISDSLLIRINVYDGTTKYPEKKITNKNIIYTLKTKIGKVGIDLAPYDIVVEDDFSIGIELLKVHGNQIGLILAGDDTPGVSFRRYTSQGEWKKYSKDALTFFVSTIQLEEEEDDELSSSILVTDYSTEQLLQTLGKNREEIGGFVFKEGEPLIKAQIRNLNSGEVTTTDERGRYTLKVDVNDELEFSYSSLEKEVRKVLETTFAINVSLEEKVVELEEVTITSAARQKRTQKELYDQYNEDNGIIKTSFGIFDKQTSGISMKMLDESDFTSGATTLGNLLRGKISGLTMRSNDNADGSTEIYLRQGGTSRPIPAAYEIDGLIVQGYPDFLDISQVKRIAVISGLAAVAKYGTVGAGGVIIINTKAANASPLASGSTIKVKTYTKEMQENVLSEEEARLNWPNFLQELYSSQNVTEAQGIYNFYEPKYGSNPNFNIDASNYFLEFWTNEPFTKQLLNENLNRFKNDVNYLKGLAFVLDKNGKYDHSVALYKQILLLRSNFVESYRDLANAYIKNKQDETGKNLYARYFKLLKEGYFPEQPEALQNVINSEVKALLEVSEDQIKSPLTNFINQDNIKTRILLEWNDDAAELNFQFISPDKNVSSWSNAMDGESNVNLLYKGYTSKDFFIYGNDGTWQINANYLGNKSGLATYLKVTVSTDYGTENQKDRIELFRMDLKNINRKLLQIP